MRWYLFLAIVGSVVNQECYRSYNFTSIESTEARACPSTNSQKLRKKIRQDVDLFLNNSVLPALRARFGACGCGGPGWRRAAYLNMSDPTQTCPPAWELITTPRRSCARPSNAGKETCYSAMFPTQGIQYSQVCGRIIAYQVGEPQAFEYSDIQSIDGPYVDGVSLTYGRPRNHIWTFAAAIDELSTHNPHARCMCTNPSQLHSPPTFIGSDYFCETGVPPGQRFDQFTFHADDPLWDGQGCGPTSTCCTFNNPPWFCKQLPQSTNADLEVRLCSTNAATIENTPLELIEIYTM